MSEKSELSISFNVPKRHAKECLTMLRNGIKRLKLEELEVGCASAGWFTARLSFKVSGPTARVRAFESVIVDCL